MKLQLREIFQVTGMHLPVSYSIPLSELEDVHGYTFAEPIAVEGEFVNRAGIVTLNYQVSCRLDAVCDRCLKPFTPLSEMPQGVISLKSAKSVSILRAKP